MSRNFNVLKEEIFMWFLLWNKALTWNILQKMNKSEPGRCNLCKCEEESNFHLEMDCSYTKQVYNEIMGLIGLQNAWLGT